MNDQSRREYFAEHGRWPDKGRRAVPSRATEPVERYAVTFTRAAPPPPPPNPFDTAYPATGGERGPIGMVWREDERFPTWSLPTQVASPRGRY
jgi:hypothetical protein